MLGFNYVPILPHSAVTISGYFLSESFVFFRAAQLVECSALERVNMDEVFEEAVRAALRKSRYAGAPASTSDLVS